MRLTGLSLLLVFFNPAFAQLSDDFSDGDFTNNPAWSGDVTSFTVNTAGQLQSNGPAATAILSLSTPNTQVNNTEWRFQVNLAFSPSDANHARIYLMSNQADLKSTVLNGYYIRIGENGSNDGVDLWRQQGSTLTKIMSGLPGTVANNPSVSVRVIRDATGNWRVWVDAAGGNNFTLQGSTIDNAIQETAFFGVACFQTTTNRQKFFFDDFQIREAPVAISQALAVNATQVKVQFSKATETQSAQQVANYSLDNGIDILRAIRDATDASLVLLILGTPLNEGVLYTLTVNNVASAKGDSLLPNSSAKFRYTVPVQYNDLVITEIFADETPRVGLPEGEFVELYNRTSRFISLNHFRLVDDTGAATFPDSIVRPHEYVILCSNSSVPLFASFSQVVGLSNFSLNNSGETLSLRDVRGKLISSVSYSDGWYHNSGKQDGGWSLEMIDAGNPCGEADNWTASENVAGGTPGKPNSVATSKPDLTPPQLVRVEVVSPTQLKIVFNEKLDSLSTVNVSAYQLDKGNRVESAVLESPGLRQINLSLSPALQEQTTYTLVIQGLTDCNANLIPSNTQVSFVLPQLGDSADVVLNEVLFNPRTGGVDFVEIYNRSLKYVTLKGWQLANVKDEIIVDQKNITTDNLIISPGHSYALTTNGTVLKGQYPKAKAENFLIMPGLPSYPDNAGTVILLNQANRLVDRFDYDEALHLPLLQDKSGVSLERISFDSKANDPTGWHSAASTEDYATPGYRNSQFRSPTANAGGLLVEPRVFTPDEDGVNDFTTLSYAFDKGGNIASIRIFDVRGREVKRLAQNQTLATEGYFRWDGTDDRGEKVRTGYYIILIELFDLNGKTQAFREKVVVGAKF